MRELLLSPTGSPKSVDELKLFIGSWKYVLP